MFARTRHVLRFVSAKIAKRPLATAVTLSCTKAGSADVFTQLGLEGRAEVDRDRLAVFLVFGALYQGAFQCLLWTRVFERIWPGSSFRASLSKLLATNFISDPVFFFPTFYVIREALASKQNQTSEEEVSLRGIVTTALSKYQKNCFQDWAAGWCVWIPGHYVTYFWMPIHLRVPWAACASFVYICLLSYLRGDIGKEAAQPSEDVAETLQHRGNACVDMATDASRSWLGSKHLQAQSCHE
mmetsp:Transcript_48635/g.103972  ORF Transcript_48635/g.103972 Transcript_48635/m.103972 type:complete len:241 (+) Transcript_48635:468-1190(+)